MVLLWLECLVPPEAHFETLCTMKQSWEVLGPEGPALQVDEHTTRACVSGSAFSSTLCLGA
jgi:hypothetical protein